MSVITLNKNNFNSEVMLSPIPVLIDFWAQWCGPCRMLSPVVDEVAVKVAGKVKVCKVNVDEESELAEKYNIMSIPTLVLIKNGKVADTAVGVLSKQGILEMIK